MTRERSSEGRLLRAVEAVLHLQGLRHQEAGARLYRQRASILGVEEEVRRLRKRRENILRRGGERVLRERRLLDALYRIVLDRRDRLRQLRREAAKMLEAYLSTKARRGAFESLRDRCVSLREEVAERRADERVGDLAATRVHKETRGAGEDACED